MTTAPIAVPTRTLPDGTALVLGLVAEGLSNREIAKRLGFAVEARQVERFVEHLMETLDLHTRADLVAWGYRVRLLERVPGPRTGPRQTARRIQVLQLLLDGGTDEEIGRKLGIGPNGVRKHLRIMYLQLKARNRSQLLKIGVDTGLVKVPPAEGDEPCSGR